MIDCLLNSIDEQIEQGSLRHFHLPLKPLAKFEENIKQEHQKGILFSLKDYLELVDFTGRCILPNKRGAIPINTAPILQRLNIDRETWIENVTKFEQYYRLRFLYQQQEFQNTG